MTLALSKSGFFEDGSRRALSPQLSVEDFTYRGSSLLR
jgi:hypothetical protein